MPAAVFSQTKHVFGPLDTRQIQVPRVLVDSAALDSAGVYPHFGTRPEGLTPAEAAVRLAEYGPNVLAGGQQTGVWRLFWRSVLNPLVILLMVLSAVSFASGDLRAGSVMVCMIVLGVGLKLIQEARADSAAAKLKQMISVTATVVRNGADQEVRVSQLVPGDVVKLAAGDMIPGDLRLVETRDLFVSQGALTGESCSVEKFAAERSPVAAPLELTSVVFLGTSVESGSATAVVVATGRETYLGGMAESLSEEPPPTAFDQGVTRFTWLMLRFLLVMAPLVFVLNGLMRRDWTGAFFFAVAVAVGLTPEMLPMIVTVCLSKGALAMSRQKVIVKHAGAIQNLGAMDILCVDKTGTLTMDRVILEKHCDVRLKPSDEVLALAYLNSHFQTGLKNVLDRAILAHTETHVHANIPENAKVDEIPFDFERRVMSVVVRTREGRDCLICKGAPEAIFPRCQNFVVDGQFLPMDHAHIDDLKQEHEQLSADGFRVLAVASREFAARESAHPYSKLDECELTLDGYVAFLDPPKDSARPALQALQAHGVQVKVITGDNDLVARKICKEVGLSTEFVLLGSDVEALTDEGLADSAQRTTLFARVSPAHKQRIIKALRSRGHVVGFMGDGINDAPALRVADVGISVDTAVDIAKASADMILLEKSLLVLDAGVLEGRKVFANVLKYVRMGASSNFGNMCSMLGASLFVPFLPMAPIQILANNMLYDLSQTPIPTDDVDFDQLQKPHPWDIRKLTRFILFIGPCSSLFDYSTFLVMLYGFNCWDTSTPLAAAHSASLFQSAWFVESLLTQTLIIHVIRTNQIPFLQSRPSWPLLSMSVAIMATAIAIPFTPLGGLLGLVPLPAAYWPMLVATLVGYVGLTQLVKTWLLKLKRI